MKRRRARGERREIGSLGWGFSSVVSFKSKRVAPPLSLSALGDGYEASVSNTLRTCRYVGLAGLKGWWWWLWWVDDDKKADFFRFGRDGMEWDERWR